MQPYKGYFIDGTGEMIHPFNPLWYPAGDVSKPGRFGSIVEVTAFSSGAPGYWSEEEL